ncbi:hypothetical protein NE237_009502 [Protea cynaroides]|uniref:glutathione transferase n=1 Tax=Protea cynaroides TaxID=273540 RepID=A0A9Q0KXV9_9MAGN|nr:hypothetical protein NE237_009502 [Protea cynaroides]
MRVLVPFPIRLESVSGKNPREFMVEKIITPTPEAAITRDQDMILPRGRESNRRRRRLQEKKLKKQNSSENHSGRDDFASCCFTKIHIQQTAMAPKLYGNVYCTATLRVVATLHEKCVEFEFPFGQVPAYVDGDLKLFESRAMTKHIAFEHHGKEIELLYHNLKKMALVSVWMEVEAHQYDPVATKLVFEQAVKPFIMKMKPDSAVILDVYEARLSKLKYSGGDEFTLADLHHLPTLQYLQGTLTKEVFEACPHVSA